MKKINKIVAVMLVLAVLSVFAASAAGYTPTEKAQLQFDSNGDFKIMQVADIQDDINLSVLARNALKQAIEEERPDLIILTGDNIADYRTGSLGLFPDVDLTGVTGAIDDFMSIFEGYYDEYGVRVAATFGNHDGVLTSVSKEEQMEIYQKYDCFIGFDEADANIKIDGCGTYNIPVFTSDYTPVTEGELDYTKVAYNLWVVDSNAYADTFHNEYDAVHENQLAYIESEAARLNTLSGKKVNSMVFQHIIVPDVYDALVEVEEGTDGAVEYDGKYYVLPDGAKGSLLEHPCPASDAVYCNEYARLTAIGAQAFYFGHDHMNDFEIDYNGSKIIMTASAGYSSYGDDSTRGVRIINLKETGDSVTFDTYMHYYETEEIVDEPEEEMNFFEKIIAWFKKLFKLLLGQL